MYQINLEKPMTFWDALILLFIYCKWAGIIDYSWWWIGAPILILAIIASFYLIGD